MSEIVLDASAFLAVVRSEPGHEKVSDRMSGSVMSAVNYSEVLKKSVERGGNVAVTAALLERAQVRVVPFDVAQARRAAEIWPSVKSCGLSLGDRACLALGMTLGAEVWTADRRMATSELPVTVRVIR